MSKLYKFSQVAEQFKVPVSSLKFRFGDAQHRKKPVGCPPPAHLEERVAHQHNKLGAADKTPADKTPADTQLKQRLLNGAKPLGIRFNGDRGGLPSARVLKGLRQRQELTQLKVGGQPAAKTAAQQDTLQLTEYKEDLKKSYSNIINPLDPPEKQRTFWCAPPMHANLAISCARSSFASYVLSLTIAALGDCSNRSFTRHFNQVSPVADISLCARDRTGMTPGIFSMVMRPVFSPKVPISRALCPWGRGRPNGQHLPAPRAALRHGRMAQPQARSHCKLTSPKCLQICLQVMFIHQGSVYACMHACMHLNFTDLMQWQRSICAGTTFESQN